MLLAEVQMVLVLVEELGLRLGLRLALSLGRMLLAQGVLLRWGLLLLLLLLFLQVGLGVGVQVVQQIALR